MGNIKMILSAVLLSFLASCLIGYVQSDKISPRLEILPVQSVQRRPVGKPLMLTCRPDVADTTLVTDLQWRDNTNFTIPPKPVQSYVPLYDSLGRSNTQVKQAPPIMYTETLPGDQSLALIIPQLSEQMGGMYYCSASYANTEMLEINVKIETYVPIKWQNAPEIQNPILGADYTVKCDVTATPPPTIDWLRNGDSIKTDGRFVVDSNGLFIRNVEIGDDGIYTCRAAVIETGELLERHIRVEIYVKPEITALPEVLEAVEGQSFSTFCNATGKPVPEYIWIKDLTQKNVATADRFLVNPQTGLLQITQVQQEDYGTYTCRAKNDAGSATTKTLLNVIVQPKIYELINVTAVFNKEIAITCRATGRPAPLITFQRWETKEEFQPNQQPDDDRIILEQHRNEEEGKSSGTLRISKVLRSDDGLYRCIARNKADTAYKTGHVGVEFPPNFDHMKELPPTFTWQERKANLSCLAMSMPNATIEWRWNGRLVEEYYDKNLFIEGNGPRSNLIVTPVDRKYYSVYKCTASNIHGKNEIDMELREARIPEFVVSAKPRVVSATTMTFDIIGPSAERGLPVVAYSVEYKEEFMRDWAQASSRDWTPDSPYIVEGLKPQTSYNFRFAARNQVGLGPWGANIIQSTPKRSAPEKPKTLHAPVQEEDNEKIVISPYSDHFELRWSVPPNNGEPIDYYEIKYCPGQKINGEWTELENECITQKIVDATNYEMTQLTGNTYYRIELCAHNIIGCSQASGLTMKTTRGNDVVLRVDKPALSSASIVGIAIGGVLFLLIIIDLLCCVTLRMGVFASMCRKTKRSPSEIDEETKLGSLYGWRFPLPYCSGQLVKEPPPSPLPLPPPVKLGGSPMASPLEEKEPLNTPPGSIKKNSSVEFDGKFVHSRSGEIIGKNSAV